MLEPTPDGSIPVEYQLKSHDNPAKKYAHKFISTSNKTLVCTFKTYNTQEETDRAHAY